MASSSLSRRTTCQSGGAQDEEYNLALRIGAVFIILGVSLFACAFPIMAKKFPRVNLSPNIVFAIRHFGTGVLIATAFVHLLPTAFTNLGDPCLSDFWTQDYPAMPGAIALAAVFGVTLVEMLLHPARRIPQGLPRRGSGVVGDRDSRAVRESIERDSRKNRGRCNCEGTENEATRATRSAMFEDVEAKGQQDEKLGLTPEQKRQRGIMHCVLLELGILFHSVFIGMTLSVSTGGKEFAILLVAISFHQMFEGLALGARIADIDWPENKLQPVYMAIAFGCTTPVGQAIGLGARSAYSPDSEVGLVLVGVMNAISAGLLVFASLVELLAEDLLTDESWLILRGKRRVYAFVLIFAGAACMSLVGAWA
ncbi:Zinc/iron permease [Hypomontagnella submonticulosa]|nr:Zinc/iron permease [Hypomontagnella submonticulosa]